MEAYGSTRAATCGDVMCPQALGTDVSCAKDARCQSGTCVLARSARTPGFKPVETHKIKTRPFQGQVPRMGSLDATPVDR
jgi:hypothetical protein